MSYSSSNYVIAPVNMGLFGLLALFAGARLQASYTASPAQKQFMPEEKIVVQFSLLAVGVVEMINSISLWVEKGYNVWGFALHMAGQFCTVVALISFMMMWARFLSFGDNSKLLKAIYWSILTLNGAITVVSISVALSCRNFNEMGDRFAVVLLVNFLVIALSMLLISGWMFLYGLRIYIRLRATSTSTDRSAAIIALRRVNLVLCVLVVCATLRVFTLVVLMVDIIRHSHDQVPGATLIYITRRVGGSSTVSSQKSGVLQSATTTSAFLSSSMTPLVSEYSSSTGGAMMNTDSIYSSGRTLRTPSEDIGLSMRASSDSHTNIPGHKIYIYGRDTPDDGNAMEESVGIAGSTAACFRHAV